MRIRGSHVFTSIFASWKEHTRLLCFSAYLTPIHLTLNSIVLVCLLVVVAPIVPCKAGRPPPCSKLIAPKPALSILSVLIFATQLCEPDIHPNQIHRANHDDLIADLSLVVFSYYLHSEDSTRRSYVTPRRVSAAPSHGSDHKRLLSNSEPYHNADMDVVEFGTITRSTLVSEPEAGYGGGMRTYEEAEGNEKERLRREMENEGNQTGSFPIPSMPETPGILTPLGQQWRDGDLPPYTS